jgi:penicillin-binding protein 1A
LGLGVISVSPLQMARAYATIANQGRVVEPIAIRYVTDRNGRTIAEPEKDLRARQARQGNSAQAMSPQAAYVMTSILQSTIKEGSLLGITGILTDLDTRPMAAKTGTTQNWSDAWTVGFSPQVTTAIWFGFDQGNRSLGTQLTGALAAGPVWAKYMKEIHKGLPAEKFPVPASGLTWVNVSASSGLLPTQYSKNIINEVFIAGTEPKAFDQIDQYDAEHNQEIENNIKNSLLGGSLSVQGPEISIPPLDAALPNQPSKSDLN